MRSLDVKIKLVTSHQLHQQSDTEAQMYREVQFGLELGMGIENWFPEVQFLGVNSLLSHRFHLHNNHLISAEFVCWRRKMLAQFAA